MNFQNDPIFISAKQMIDNLNKQMEPTIKLVKDINKQFEPTKQLVENIGNSIPNLDHAQQLVQSVQPIIVQAKKINASIPSIQNFYSNIYYHVSDTDYFLSPDEFSDRSNFAIRRLLTLASKEKYSEQDRKDILSVASILVSENSNQTNYSKTDNFDELVNSQGNNSIFYNLKHKLEQYSPSLTDSDFYISQLAALVLQSIYQTITVLMFNNADPISAMIVFVALANYFYQKKKR